MRPHSIESRDQVKGKILKLNTKNERQNKSNYLLYFYQIVYTVRVLILHFFRMNPLLNFWAQAYDTTLNQLQNGRKIPELTGATSTWANIVLTHAQWGSDCLLEGPLAATKNFHERYQRIWTTPPRYPEK